MKVLIACEFSGIVREAFRAKGHDAWSCDLLDTEIPSFYHYKGNVLDLIKDHWDLMIAHPPCTFLAASGARWYHDRPDLINGAYKFVKRLKNANADRICIENPVGRLTNLWRKPDQYIQPWQFGEGETKKTGLWLINLPLLKPTNIVDGREPRCWKEKPGADRWKNRSRTYPGIAEAMADQWGALGEPSWIV